LFRRARDEETIAGGDETVFRFGADILKQPVVIRLPTNGGDRRHQTGDSQMRTISFILAFAFALAGPSMVGSADNGLPGIGTFAYHGSPVTVAASQPLVIAAK
jgi:hypothetical protein